MKSTSIHNLNADRGLNFFNKLLYLFFNFINNLFPNLGVSPEMEISNFVVSDLDKFWPKLSPKSSVGRKLSDLFWMTLPWAEIKNELGEIRIFDTGCGSGNYGLRIEEASGVKLASYTGIDAKVKPNWQELMASHSNFKLIQNQSDNISSLIPTGTNFFMTQSAIEHFDSDLAYFNQTKEYIKNYQKPVIQVHIFPASACLKLYLFHGIRQYTPRTISKIAKLFSDFSEIKLFELGGREGQKLHWQFVTKPYLILRKDDWRETKTKEYEKKSLEAIKQDMQNNNHQPIFYALVIHSYPNKKIYD
jgi:hypothetical protein